MICHHSQPSTFAIRTSQHTIQNCKRAFLFSNAFLPIQKQNQFGVKHESEVARMKGQENPAGNKVSYVIGRQVVKLSISTFNKHVSNLKVKCFEMPNATYTNRWGALKTTITI
jgi:hypothetical protein